MLLRDSRAFRLMGINRTGISFGLHYHPTTPLSAADGTGFRILGS